MSTVFLGAELKRLNIFAEKRKNIQQEEARDMEIRRDIYLNKLISKKHNGLIKVVTGIRCFLFFDILLGNTPSVYETDG